MLLTVRERMLLLGILPGEGDVTALRIIRKLREDVGFSEQEHVDLKIETLPTGGVRWDDTQAVDKDVDIGLKATHTIVTALTTLSAQKKLKAEQLDLYEKFVGKEE